MENSELKQVQKTLLVLFWTVLAVNLLMVAIFENEWLPVGEAAGDETAEFMLVGSMELLTVALIPLSLRLFKFKKIAEELKNDQKNAFLKWAVVRMCTLMILMLGNTLLYYLFMNTTFGYMALILLLCMPFIYPSYNRCVAETTETQTTEAVETQTTETA